MAPEAPTPPRRREALRTLRVQVSLALVLAAALCALVANKSSGDELAGAYVDAGQGVLATASASFESRSEPGDLRRPHELRRQLDAVRELHPGLSWVAVYSRGGRELAGSGPRPSALRASATARRAAATDRRVRNELRSDGHHLTTLAAPLRGRSGQPAAWLELSFDLAPADAALSDRNQTILLVLTALLLSFALFTMVVLDRRIFRPLDRLRSATNQLKGGNLSARLGWKGRDEIGKLAGDFDSMAEALQGGHKRLESLALEDSLTGLSNHRHFQEALAAEIERGSREGTSVALVIVDIDHFKRINDARGHPFGDDVLRGVGDSLSRGLKGMGRAARLGGDEFAVVLPGVDREQAFALCEAARASVAAFTASDYELSCSAGIAFFPHDASHSTDLVQLADGALYWAKQSGRACTRMYDPEHVFVVTEAQRAEFGSLLEQPAAIRSVFQPLVWLSSGEVAGYEALARFEDRRGLSPSWWFARAHRFGLGASLEAEAVRVALAAPGRPAGAFLSVNLSPSALRSPEVAGILPDDLDGIVLEITETEEILDDTGLQAALAPLRARGARVAVDDAGAGYAGLQQVMAMHADIIKLDRALISAVNADRAKAALVRALVHFAAETGADLCAEGVETLDELQTLGELGVALGQGYVLARPAAPWVEPRTEATEACRRIQETGGSAMGGRPLRGRTSRGRRPT